MPHPKNSIPKFLTDANGRAFTKVEGRFVSLGRAGTTDSQERYAEVLKLHAQGQLETLIKREEPAAKRQAGLTLNELFIQFSTREFQRYSKSEAYAFQTAIRVCRQLFGETLVSEFGPLRFRTMRDAMVNGDEKLNRKPWCRRTANRQAKRIRQILRWGVSWELVPVEVVHNLDTVRALAIGETTAIDYAPRAAVPDADIQAIREVLRPYYRDVFDLMLLTGARPGEILKLTGGMIQRRPDGIWLAELSDHKTARKGKPRFLAFNVAAQAILLRHMQADPAALLFPHRRDNFTAAVSRACKRTKVTKFCPHQLRHTTAARLVDEVGLEGAQAVLGHSEIAMTLHYARSAEKQASEAVRRLG